MAYPPRPWRAWHTFLTALGLAFLSLLVAMTAALLLHGLHGRLERDQTNALLRLLYWGTYPLAFVALGALAWHFIQSERGAYARR